MIHHLNPEKYYTNRKYLTQWFEKDILVVTDNDFDDQEVSKQLLTGHPIKNRMLDITHNTCPDNSVPFEIFPILTNNFEYWYRPETGRIFFPLWLWMYNQRNALWWQCFGFDAGSKKTQGIMCLNHTDRDYRTWLWNAFRRRDLVDRMLYTFGNERLLPGEVPGPHRADPSVDHEVYNQYAVNIVTESTIDLAYVSEKTCKPFVARQIPVIVGSVGINKFLQDIGLDMFEDIVPWHEWDSESNSDIKLKKIANFVEQWINSDNVLSDYQRVLPRVERNKQYFHSEQFRNIIMNQMSNFEPA